MNGTKIAAFIFVPFGTFISIVSTLYYNKALEVIFPGIELEPINLFSVIVSISISVLLCAIAITNLVRDKKHIAVGILLLLFTNILSGIFYLIWRVDTPSNNESVSSVGWICPQCGRKNYYSNKCNCGYIKKDNDDLIIDIEPSKKKCPYCNHENDSDAIYCSNCGKNLKD